MPDRTAETLPSMSIPVRWLIVVLFVVVGVGMSALLVVDQPRLYLAVVPGLVIGYLIFRSPVFGFYLVVASLPLEVAGHIIPIGETFQISIARIFALLTISSYIVHLLVYKIVPKWEKELTIWILYFFVGSVSLITAYEFDRGVEEIVRTVQNILFFWLIISIVQTRAQLKTTIVVLVVASVISFSYAIFQKFFPMNVINERGLDWLQQGTSTYGVELSNVDTQGRETLERVSGTTIHANVLALNCTYMIPFLFAYLRLNASALSVAISWVAIAITMGAFGTTLSRAGFLTLGFSGLLLITTGLLQVTSFRLVAFAVLALLALPFLPDGFIERVLSPASYLPSNSGSLSGRLELWNAALEAIFDHPLMGFGIGNEHTIFRYWKPEWSDNLGTVMNTYLQIPLEIGIVGLLVFLGFLWMIFRRLQSARKEFRRRGDREMVMLGAAFFVTFLACLISWMSVEFLRAGFKNVWVIMGCIIAYHRLSLLGGEAGATKAPPVP